MIGDSGTGNIMILTTTVVWGVDFRGGLSIVFTLPASIQLDPLIDEWFPAAFGRKSWNGAFLGFLMGAANVSALANSRIISDCSQENMGPRGRAC